jgi:hypothetical protein
MLGVPAMAAEHPEIARSSALVRCVRVESEILIDRQPQLVFEYVTTPALCHTWHPATVQVRGVPNRPLTVGETMIETIAVAGRRDEARWTLEQVIEH